VYTSKLILEMDLCVQQVPICTIFSSFSVRIGSTEPMKPVHVCKGGTVNSVTWHEGMLGGGGGGGVCVDLKVLLYPSFNLCVRWGWVVSATPQLLYLQKGRIQYSFYRRLPQS
jgi:hypothetical protein